MTPAETAAFLRRYNEWRRDDEDISQFDVCKIGEAIDAAVEMIDRCVKLERALQAMTKTYKSVPYAQWPPEMHTANEVLEKSK